MSLLQYILLLFCVYLRQYSFILVTKEVSTAANVLLYDQNSCIILITSIPSVSPD